MAKEKEAAEVPASGVRARVLVELCLEGSIVPVDSVVTLDAAALEALSALGAIDTSPDAVAYAESLAG